MVGPVGMVSVVLVNTCLWGKDLGGDAPYPVAAHLLDAAAGAAALWDLWLPKNCKERLEDVAGVDSCALRQVVVLGSGLHDLGKVSPGFQFKATFRDADRHRANLTSNGFADDRWTGTAGHLGGRHEVLSDLYVRSDTEVPDLLSMLVFGHHGAWVGERLLWNGQVGNEEAPYSLMRFVDSARSGESRWGEQVAAHRRMVEGVLGLAPDVDVDWRVVPLLTAVVTLGDWLASDERTWAASCGHEVVRDPNGWFARRVDELSERVQSELCPGPRPRSLREAFPKVRELRDVQAKMLERPAAGLSVVMAETGVGKTEAAVGQWLEIGDEDSGLYFALPTMATADAIFDRMRNVFADADEQSGVLAHGRASLNAFYSEIATDVRIPHDSDVNGGSRTGLAPVDFFAGPHRALLAPIGVGTVDQLLSGVLVQRFNYLRLLGLAGKTVVLDEVHSYDPYMTMLLERFLEWAGVLGIRVVLLSATMPTVRLERFVTAYGGGALNGDAGYPAIVHVAPSVGSGAGSEPEIVALEAAADRKVEVHITERSTYDVTEAILGAVRTVRDQHPDARIGVIVNRVATAQQVASTLDAEHLLHSRLIATAKQRKVNEALSAFGPEGTAGGVTAVGTQIIEQSLNLDFDVLVTEICPATSLVQRLGRLWRFERPDRGTKSAHPQVIVVDHDGPGDGWYRPYFRAEIRRTREALTALGGVLRVPGDVQQLVDAAEVTAADLAEPVEDDVEQWISMGAHRAKAEERAVCRPADLDEAIRLPLFSGGASQSETRAVDQETCLVLVVSTVIPDAWDGPVPERADRATRNRLLGATVPVSGRLARDIRSVADVGRPVQPIDHLGAMFKGAVAVDLDGCDWLIYDEYEGLKVAG